ncbi:MAG TPA: GNAT family N-acetyltransferase [Verrucomicrobiales bacterium]|jgi:predicted GNAT family N-acyltransferase|nr:GNAT family N-acetyltransferase [Verrucomicrobiales bacterium]
MSDHGLVFNLLVALPTILYKDVQLDRFIESFQQVAIKWTNETVHFSVQFLNSTDALNTAIIRLAQSSDPTFSIIVSDKLTSSAAPGALAASELTKQLRALFFRSQSYCGLIALYPGENCMRASDVDLVLPASTLQSPTLLREYALKVVHRLWYKAPPSKRTSSSPPLVTTNISSEQFRKCLELRYTTYGMLGYIDREVEDSELKIEMDFFDPQAVHIAALEATTQRVIGTARLIVPGNAPPCSDIKFFGEKYCREWADKEPYPVFRQRLDQGTTASMPIFDTFPFPQTYKRRLRPIAKYCELSRLIVDPEFRGMGVGSALIQFCFDTARKLARKVMVLECAPHHQKMYEQYGFNLIVKGKKIFYSRARELDQMAIAMAAALTDDVAPWVVSDDS